MRSCEHCGRPNEPGSTHDENPCSSFLESRIYALEEALEFYANPKNYEQWQNGQQTYASAVFEDGGSKARSLLTERETDA